MLPVVLFIGDKSITMPCLTLIVNHIRTCYSVLLGPAFLFNPIKLKIDGFDQLKRGEPLLQILPKTRSHNPPQLFTTTGYPPCHEITAHLCIRKRLLRSIPVQHLIQDDPHTPHVTLTTVDVVPITLRTHVSR